jgi:hypothetical protein
MSYSYYKGNPGESYFIAIICWNKSRSTYIISLLISQVQKEFECKENTKQIHHIDIENVSESSSIISSNTKNE